MVSNKNKVIGFILAGLTLLGGGGYVGSQTLFSGTGVTPAEQWTSTTTPNAGITQRIYGKDLIFSGLENCNLDTDADGLVTCGTDAVGGGGGGSGNVATSTTETAGQLAYWTSTGATPATLGKVATGTITVPTGLTGTASRYVVGGNFTLGLDTGYVIPLQSTLDAKALGATTLTIAGTANQLTSSAGAQDLSTNRTWTLSLPNHVIFPGNFRVNNSTTTNATTTNQDITGLLTFNGVTASTWAAFCTTITGGSGLCDGTDSTSAGGADPFTWEANYGAINAATTSILWGKNGINASSTSHFVNASTTQLSIGSDFITDFSGGFTITSAGVVNVNDVTAAMLNAEDFGSFTCNGTTCSLDSGSVDISSNTNLAASWPIVLTGDTLSWNATTTPWAANQFVYTNAAGLLVTAASSSLALPNTALANSTISGIALGSNLADLTATNGTLTFSGTYNGGTARTIGLNLANANTWTALQQFSNATSTLFSSTYASTTNQVIGNNLTFGGVTGNSWDDFCTTITGSSALCDGDDATGGGGSAVASTTADVIIYKKGTTYYAYNASTTVVTSNSDFDALLQANVNLFDDGAVSINSLGGKIYIMPGVYYVDTTVTINGNDNGGDDDSGSVTIEGSGQEATKIVLNANAHFLDFDHAAMPKVRNLSVYIKGSSSAFVSDSATNDARAVWQFEFTNIHISATTTTTGYGFDLGNAFRGTFTNIEMFDLHNCARFVAEGTFNPGDFTWNRSFCELDNAANAVAYQFTAASTGFYNQVYFIMAEAIAQNTGAKFIYATSLNYSNFVGLNAEQFDVLADIEEGSSNVFEFNYATHRDGIASLRGCRFWPGAYNNSCDFKFLNTSANFTVVDDMDDWGDTPNTISGYIGSDSGTASASTTGFTIYRDIKGYGTLDTTLAPGGRFGIFKFFGDLIARANAVVDFASALWLRLPTAASFTFNNSGQVGYDTTSGNLLLATSTTNTAGVVIASATSTLYSFTATTSPIVSGTVMELPPNPLAQTATKIACKVTGGTSLVVNLSDGTNDTNAVTCTTTWTYYSLTSNNNWTADERINVEFGTKTGTTGDLVMRIMGYRTSN